MRRRALTALAAVAGALAAAAPAPAATALGETSASGAPCQADRTLAQVASAEPRHTVPSAGVITELRTPAPSVEGVRVKVLRPKAGGAFAVLASLPVAKGAGIASVPARVPVQPGDVLGLATGPDGHDRCLLAAGAGTADVVARSSVPTPVTGDVALPETDVPRRLNVSARLEPDADRDGYGDETQDRCPGDPTRALVGCEADLAASLTVLEPQVQRDELNLVIFEVRNLGSSPARDVRLLSGLGAVRLVFAAPPTGGACAGPGVAVDCTLPSLGAGEAATVTAVVRSATNGRRELLARVGSATPDPDPTNDTAEGSFGVTSPRTVTDPAAFCRVPRLRGRTRTAARRSLEAAGCRLGRVVRKRFRAGRRHRVRTQTIPAGVRVATRTRVHVRIRR